MFGCLLFLICFGEVWPTKGWVSVRPEVVGLDSAVFDRLDADIKAGAHGAVHSLLIVKKGQLVFESYYPIAERVPAVIGTEKGRHQLQSSTKSVTSLVLGAAIEDGLIATDPLIRDVLPRVSSLRRDDWNPPLSALLTMRMGLAWQQWHAPNGVRDNMVMMRFPDWLGYVLQKDAQGRPGSRFVYHEGAPLLVAAAVSHVTGKRFDDYAKQALFDPMGIGAVDWQLRDGTGLPHTGASLAMTARDFARLGLLVLRKGRWEGAQLVSSAFLEKAVSVHVDQTTTSGSASDLRRSLKYGYFFWLLKDDNTYLPMTLGRGENAFLVVPKHDMVLVMNGWIEGRAHLLKLAQLYRDVIKPSLANVGGK